MINNQIIFENENIKLNDIINSFKNLKINIQFINSRGKLKFDSNKNRYLNNKINREEKYDNLPLTFSILEKLKHNKTDKIERSLKINKTYLNLTYIAIRDKQNKYMGCLRIVQDITNLINKYKFGGFIESKYKKKKKKFNNYHFKNNKDEEYRKKIENELIDINTDENYDVIASASENW